MNAKDIKNYFDSESAKHKEKISAYKGAKKVFSYILYFLTFGFKLAFRILTDKKNIIIFLIVCAIVGSEVWLPFLLGIITRGSSQSIIFFSVASAGLMFWNVVPCTPFILICVILTFLVRGILDKSKLFYIISNLFIALFQNLV